MQKDKDQGINQNIVYHKAAMIDEQLFSLDVKADQLRFFLEQVVAVVNGHSNSINIIQNDILRRVQAKDLELSLSRISESISLRDMEFLKVVSSTLDKPLAETSGNGLEDATNRVINKEAVISSGMSWLYKKMNAWDTKLSRLDDELNLKVKKEDMSKKFKKTKKKLRDEMEAKEKGLIKKVHDIGVHTNQTIANIQSNMSEMEKKTLWKINDCETLLHKRINSEFVENSCKSVYDRIIKEMERMKEDNFKIINQDVQEMKAKITLNEDNSQEKLKGMRSTIKDFQDQLNLKFVNVERLEITRNALQDRISEIQMKIQDLQRKMDATSNLEKQIPIIQSLEEKLIQYFMNRAHQLEGITDLQKKELEELKIKFEVMGEMGGSSGTKSDLDPHKVCSLDADVKRLKIDNQDNENKLRQIDQEMKRKLDHFEQRIIGQLSVLKTNNSQGGVSKDEILLTVERDIGSPNSMLRAKIIQILQSALSTGTNQSLEQTLKAIIQDIADITKKTDSLMDLEKKIKRKFKQLTSNETVDFAKQLEEKADKEQLQKELNMMNEKYKTLQDLITTLRQNFSALEQFSEHIESLIQTNSQETISIITGNNRIIHQRCVVCGNKSKTSKTVCDVNSILYQQKSQDYGQPRMYKGDARPNNIYEASDVYEIPPSQITLVQESQKYLSTTVGQKHPVVNFKESSKTDLSNTNQNTNQSTFYSPNRNFRPLSATQKKG